MAAKHWYAFVRDLHTDGCLKLRTDKVWILREEDGEVTRRHFDLELYNAQKSNLQFGMVVKTNIHKIIILDIDETTKGLSEKMKQCGPLEPLTKVTPTSYVLSTIKKKEEKQAAASQSTKSNSKKRSEESKQGENEAILCKTVSRKDTGATRAASTSSNKAVSLHMEVGSAEGNDPQSEEDNNEQVNPVAATTSKATQAASTSSNKADLCHSITESHSKLQPSFCLNNTAINKKGILSKDTDTQRSLSADMEVGSAEGNDPQSEEDNNEQVNPVAATTSKLVHFQDICHPMNSNPGRPTLPFCKASTSSNKVSHGSPGFGSQWGHHFLQLEYNQDSHENSPSHSSHQENVNQLLMENERLKEENKRLKEQVDTLIRNSVSLTTSVEQINTTLSNMNKSKGGLENLKFAVELEEDYVGIELGKDEVFSK